MLKHEGRRWIISALSAVELVLRSELNCNASIESDSFFWFGLLSFSEVIDKASHSATQLL